jgi:toxin HigB-1
MTLPAASADAPCVEAGCPVPQYRRLGCPKDGQSLVSYRKCLASRSVVEHLGRRGEHDRMSGDVDGLPHAARNSDRDATDRWRAAPSAITVAVHNGMRYCLLVLQSFSDKDTERVWRRQRSKRLDQPSQRAALRKLLILDAADEIGDLRIPPGNRLEKLKGDRANSYSIRINDQWRICFRWTTAGPEDVEIVDYH